MARSANRTDFADTLRGIACLCVVMIHLWGPYWTGPDIVARWINSAPDQNVGVSVIHAAIRAIPQFDLGAFGVGLFFLISGFVIPISLEKYSSSAFLVARAWRIFPTYAMCFTLTLITIALVGAYWQRHFPYKWHEIALHYLPGVRFFAGTPNIDLIVWSLDIEIIFYVLCAIVAPWFRRRNPAVLIVPFFLAGLFALHSLGPFVEPSQLNLIAFLVFMFIGTVVFFHMRGVLGCWASLALGVALLAMADCVMQATLNIPILQLIRTSYFMAVMVFCISYRLRSVMPTASALTAVAAISYPLYAVHEILGYALLRVFDDFGVQADICCLLTLALVMMLAATIHRLVERPTQSYGRRLALLFSSKNNVAAAAAPLVLPAPNRGSALGVPP